MTASSAKHRDPIYRRHWLLENTGDCFQPGTGMVASCMAPATGE
jgi:hypothetical protein